MSDSQRTPDLMEKAFREGAFKGRLLVPFCLSCEQPHWYPRPFCPHCGHAQVAFRASPGTGTIYSLTWLHARDKPPQSVAYIRLDEGVTMVSRLVGDAIAQAAIGQRVQVAFAPGPDGQPVPVFSPAP